MATSAEVQQVAQALSRLSTAAQADFMRLYATLDHSDWESLRRTLEQFWPELIGHYGEMASVLASDQFAIQAAELGITGESRMVRGVDPDRANARMRWAIGVPDQQGSLLLLLDELVKQPYRSTLQHSAHRAGAAWARVPVGETCAFCLMLSSRGAVYDTRENAKFTSDGDKYHGDCDCTPVLAKSNADLPYDADALYEDVYQKARSAAGGDQKDILAEIRAQQGTH